MLLALALVGLVAAAAGKPVVYDQRQDGMVNVAADVQNVVFVVAIPQKMSLPLDLLDDFMKNNKKPHTRESAAQDRADHAMDAFVEPSTPYRVEIGESDRSVEGEGRAVEVVIAGRRRAGPEPQNENESEEIKLLGATEQCGPDRERDPVTLICRFKIANEPLLESQPNKDAIVQEPNKEEIMPEQAPEILAS